MTQDSRLRHAPSHEDVAAPTALAKVPASRLRSGIKAGITTHGPSPFDGDPVMPDPRAA